MGQAESKFHKAVKDGDHYVAYDLYFGKKMLRDSVDPNYRFENDSAILHYTALYAMQPIYEDFLEKKNASPWILDGSNRTCLHLICSSSEDAHVRTDMLRISLNFSPDDLSSSLQHQDKEGNTPLHYAASSGLTECVNMFLTAGVEMVATNEEGKTPADLAKDHGHQELANRLETLVVFKSNESSSAVEVNFEEEETERTQGAVAMKAQELQSMKDGLLIETTELLGVSLFIAEALLRNHGWSKEQLLEAWMSDPAAACDQAGVEMPAVLSIDNLDECLRPRDNKQLEATAECGICYMPVEELVEVPCEHIFCGDCWQQYLHQAITSGDVQKIVCPGYACYRRVPIYTIEKLISREMAQRYLKYDIKAFVDSNPNMRWCPHPGCGQAVQKPASLTEAQNETEVVVAGAYGAAEAVSEPKEIAAVVCCGDNHYFCWTCGKEPHEPCSCQQWRDWLKEMAEMKTRMGNQSSAEMEEFASVNWVACNSKPCPHCGVPIEKTDGCNHMQCRKCRHSFCWMCLDPWSKHNSSTGGYYQCNRYKQKKETNDMLTKRKEEVEEFSSFLHYCSRYENHKHSLSLEQPYLHAAQEKMAELVQNLQLLGEAVVVPSMHFVEDAVVELVRGRQVLIASYVYAYRIVIRRVLDKFEQLQGRLEEKVEALAEVVARPHLRKPRSEIILITRLAREERESFLKQVAEGIKPDPVPFVPYTPNMSWRNSFQSDQSGRSEHLRRLREELEQQRQEIEEERMLRQALALSRREYTKQSQLRKDEELARHLSMTDRLPAQHLSMTDRLPARHLSLTDRLPARHLSLTDRLPEDNGSPMGEPVNELNFFSLHLPHSSASQNSDPDQGWTRSEDVPMRPPRDPTKVDLGQWRRTLIEGWPEEVSSEEEEMEVSSLPGYTSAAGAEFGPLYGEDEDLAKAIALSLAEQDVVQTSGHRNEKQTPSPSVDHWNNLNDPPPLPPCVTRSRRRDEMVLPSTMRHIVKRVSTGQ